MRETLTHLADSLCRTKTNKKKHKMHGLDEQQVICAF